MADLSIRTERLTKVFKGDLGKKTFLAVDGLDLQVEQGEVFAFLGPNGAGKTTTIKLLTRLLKPTRGQIWIYGDPAVSVNALQRIGFLPEQPRFYGYLTGSELLDFIARVFRIERSERIKKISALLDRVGLQGKGDVKIREYSRGMVQRLGFAQALMNDPDLLILDEPMASLDPVGRKDFRDLILEQKVLGKSIFFSSHILSDAELIADRVFILNRGKRVSTGKIGDIISNKIFSVEITFILDSEKITPEIEALNAVIQEDRVMIRVSEHEDLSEWLRRIEGWGGRIRSVVPQQKDLESFFMDEIGR